MHNFMSGLRNPRETVVFARGSSAPPARYEYLLIQISDVDIGRAVLVPPEVGV